MPSAGRRTGRHHDVGRDAAGPTTDRIVVDPVAAVEHVHRVLVLAAADEEDRRRSWRAGRSARTTSGKKIQASGLGQPAGHGDGVDADAEDHRADVLGGGRLEQVGAAAGAVADVVADEVGDDGRVARVVLGDARPRPCRRGRRRRRRPWCRSRRRAGRTGPRTRRRSRSRRSGTAPRPGWSKPPYRREDPVHAEQRQGDDQEAGDGAAAHRDLDRLDEAAPRRRRGPHVRLAR